MTITIYAPPADQAVIKLAKRIAKQKKDSISRVAMDAIRKYADKHYQVVK